MRPGVYILQTVRTYLFHASRVLAAKISVIKGHSPTTITTLDQRPLYIGLNFIVFVSSDFLPGEYHEILCLNFKSFVKKSVHILLFIWVPELHVRPLSFLFY